MSKAKQFRALNTISDSIKKLAGEKVFERILKKKPKKKVRFLDNIKIVSLRRSRKDNLKVRKYLFRWKKNANKKKERDNKLKDALNVINKRQTINKTNDMIKIMTITIYKSNIISS